MPHDPKAFLALSLLAIPASQKELAAMLGIATRTAQRWSTQGVPPSHLPDLARIVHPHDAALAREIAAAAGATLVSLGLEAPAPPPVPPAPPVPLPLPEPPDGIVDAVVCAASEAMGMMPADVRPGLLAAFARAGEIGASVAFVERVLRAQVAPAAPPPTTARRA
jgi:hypothetical protein